jgi:uncharacterized protein (TIGR02466 family)
VVERIIHNGGSKMKVWKALSGHVLVQDDIGTPEQRNNILSQSYMHQRSSSGNNKSNDGCWRADIKYQNADWLYNALESQLNATVDYYMQEDPAYPHVFTGGNTYIESWTNINDPGSSNLLHTHKLFNYSAIYYVQAEGTGDIVFLNPANLDLSCSYEGPGVARMHYPAKDGTILMWPSWMPHEVTRNESDKQRVCIAFNIRFTK